MIDFIQKLFESSDAFTLGVRLKGGAGYTDASLFAADATGIVIEIEGMKGFILLPWTSIEQVGIVET
jgi:hypothetical protein